MPRAYTPARIMRAHDVTSPLLVDIVTEAARSATGEVSWPAVAKTYSPEQLARIVHAYLRDHIRYKEEKGDQIVRRPAALVAMGVGDCKSTAVFAGSLLAAAGLDVKLKFIQTADRPWWCHVYVVCNSYIVDPLLPFNHEATYTECKTEQL